MYQMPYTHHLYPNHGSAPPQMKFDLHGSPFPYETPQGVLNHGQPIPMGYHSCCNYGYVPGYYNPPYPHYPPPPPFYYPSFLPMYPVHYPPPPHYQMEQPRYEFAKNQMTGHHCSGCPGHQSRKKEDRLVEIQQQEPDIEKIEKIPSKSHSYPLVLVPPEYMNSREKRNEPEPKKSEQKSENRNQFPFPIVWIPYKGSKEGGEGSEESKLLGNKGENSTIEPKKDEKRVGIDEMMKKISNQKVIPVKQVWENEQKGKEIKENKLKSTEVKQEGESTEKKISECPNKPKLPPVCLRVEPLRKKRNGSNGNSRSPSPKRDETKSSSCPQNEKFEHKDTKAENEAIEVRDERVEGSKGIKENEEIKDVVTKRDETKSSSCLRNEKFEHKDTKIEKEAIEVRDERVEGSNGIKQNEEIKAAVAENSEKTKMLEKIEKENCDLDTKAKKKLSEVEAAIKIQSVYRGFEVRRWEQLKKLKQIGEIREKTTEIKTRIKDLEASTDNSSNEKQRVVIGEMIMSLLLKLDTIQGLHPSVREIRKSVAKELATLQEQLDSMDNKSSELSSVELMEDPVGGEKKAQLDKDIITLDCVNLRDEKESSLEKEISEEVNDGAEIVSSVSQLKAKEGAKENEKESSVELAGGIRGDILDGEVAMNEINDTDFKSSSIDTIETEAALEGENKGLDGCVEDHETGVQVQEDQEREDAKVVTDTSPEPDPEPDQLCPEPLEKHVQDPELYEIHGQGGALKPDETDKTRGEEEKVSGEVLGENKHLDDCIENHETGVQVQEDKERDGAKIVTDTSPEPDPEPDQPCPEPLEEHVQDPEPGQPLPEPLEGHVQDLESDEIHGEKETPNLGEMKGFEKKETPNLGEMKGFEKEVNEPTEIENHETGVQVQGDQERDGANIVTETSSVSNIKRDQPLPEPLEEHVQDPESDEIHCKEVNEPTEIENIENNITVGMVENSETVSSKLEEMCPTKLDNALTEENHDPVENKYVLEIENPENTNMKSIKVENDTKLAEENEKLREMVAKLVEAGKEQLSVISSLSGRVKDLETKLI